MQAVYAALGIQPPAQPPTSGQVDPRALWLVYSFREAGPDDLGAAKVKPSDVGLAFRVWIFEHDAVLPVPAQPMRFRVSAKNNSMRKFVAFESHGRWKAAPI
jgi:hypothetical protein